MKRKKPLRANPDKVREWVNRSRTSLKRGPIKNRAKKRSLEESAYLLARAAFFREFPTCPITGGPATQIHHSAKREGGWLNLRRYWIGVSLEGHELIERNKASAESFGLMVRIREDYRTHIRRLEAEGHSLTYPLFYESWDGQPLLNKLVDKIENDDNI